MRYQQFASHAYCGAAGPVSKMALQQEKALCVFRFEVSRSVITVQREFRARFRKDAPCDSYLKLTYGLYSLLLNVTDSIECSCHTTLSCCGFGVAHPRCVIKF